LLLGNKRKNNKKLLQRITPPEVMPNIKIKNQLNSQFRESMHKLNKQLSINNSNKPKALLINNNQPEIKMDNTNNIIESSLNSNLYQGQECLQMYQRQYGKTANLQRMQSPLISQTQHARTPSSYSMKSNSNFQNHPSNKAPHIVLDYTDMSSNSDIDHLLVTSENMKNNPMKPQYGNIYQNFQINTVQKVHHNFANNRSPHPSTSMPIIINNEQIINPSRSSNTQSGVYNKTPGSQQKKQMFFPSEIIINDKPKLKKIETKEKDFISHPYTNSYDMSRSFQQQSTQKPEDFLHSQYQMDFKAPDATPSSFFFPSYQFLPTPPGSSSKK
jgi:hypothetical protein